MQPLHFTFIQLCAEVCKNNQKNHMEASLLNQHSDPPPLVNLKINFPVELMLKIINLSRQNLPAPPPPPPIQMIAPLRSGYQQNSSFYNIKYHFIRALQNAGAL